MLELKLPLEWAEPSDRIELLAGELDELAPLSPWRRREKTTTKGPVESERLDAHVLRQGF